MGSQGNRMSIVDATISDIAALLALGHTNSVELTVKSLLRIAKYDRRSTLLNSIPIINEQALEDAQASDQVRALSGPRSRLEGIPCTIKDSYKMKGMTVAAGSPAFRHLMANEDAFTVAKIKESGAVILGRTNMPPMAAGGMQRGVYGRAESPYNAKYLAAAFASGSSNGSAVATAASFGMFGMGEETISSGRSPASNNALVAYTPSRGMLSLRGNWPLFPTCDVVVPHTRTVEDMFSLLDVLVAKDDKTTVDFWREQPFIKLPEVKDIRPASYHDLADHNALSGANIGVPKMYIGGQDSDPAARKVYTCQSVIDLWHNARSILEALGATVTEVDFPLISSFEATECVEQGSKEDSAPPHRNEIDMCRLMAYAWDDFLAANGDANVARSLAQVDSSTIFPRPPGALQDRYDVDDPLVRHKDVLAQVKNGRRSTYELPGLEKALRNLEQRRKIEFEEWLDSNNLDALVWPCSGDVGKADADINKTSATEAWRNGVLYSNGNCAIRQLGIPTVNVPMGLMGDAAMPVNLTFASKAYSDSLLFRYAYAFEAASRLRRPPPRTPALVSDFVTLTATKRSLGKNPPTISISEASKSSFDGLDSIRLSGTCCKDELLKLQIYVDGDEVEGVEILQDRWHADIELTANFDMALVRPDELRVPEISKSMVIVFATGKSGRATAKMAYI